MNKDAPAGLSAAQNDREKPLKDQVLKVIASRNLENHRRLINAIASELNASELDCAAAIAYLYQESTNVTIPESVLLSKGERQNRHDKSSNLQGIRLVRYRLDLGNQHKVSVEQIKKVLVEESGVDIKNISNVRVMDSYTLIDLPDEMPQEIFHHLKTTEINDQKLDIRRVKPRNKKRANRKNRHTLPTILATAKEPGN